MPMVGQNSRILLAYELEDVSMCNHLFHFMPSLSKSWGCGDSWEQQ
jgi:hypothetical protein